MPEKRVSLTFVVPDQSLTLGAELEGYRSHSVSVYLSVCLSVCMSVYDFSRTTGYEEAYERYQQLQCYKGSLGSRPSPYVRVLIARGWANRREGLEPRLLQGHQKLCGDFAETIVLER